MSVVSCIIYTFVGSVGQYVTKYISVTQSTSIRYSSPVPGERVVGWLLTHLSVTQLINQFVINHSFNQQAYVIAETKLPVT